MQANGPPTRREFDRLEQRVDLLYDKGTPLGARLEGEIGQIRREINDLKQMVDKRLGNIYRIIGTAAFALVGILISIVTALATGALE